jgi:hypothetical protein
MPPSLREQGVSCGPARSGRRDGRTARKTARWPRRFALYVSTRGVRLWIITLIVRVAVVLCLVDLGRIRLNRVAGCSVVARMCVSSVGQSRTVEDSSRKTRCRSRNEAEPSCTTSADVGGRAVIPQRLPGRIPKSRTDQAEPDFLILRFGVRIPGGPPLVSCANNAFGRDAMRSLRPNRPRQPVNIRAATEQPALARCYQQNCAAPRTRSIR